MAPYPTTNGTTSGLNIIIVGAGIAGLATATALTQNGKHHNVTVLESHPGLNEFGASIGILPNGVKCLRSLGLESEFVKVVVRHSYQIVMDGITGRELGHIAQNKKNWSTAAYGDECWNINRQDYQNVLADGAQAGGAKIVYGVDIVDIDTENCIVNCASGDTYHGDVIIGADGMKSIVRKHIPTISHVEPVAWITESAYRCTVPKSEMIGNPLLQELLDDPNEMLWWAPGRYILTWPLPPNRPFDVVFGITEPGDVPLGKWGYTVDPQEATSKFQDFCPQMQELMKHVNKAVKWTLGELPPLETCRSANGRGVLIGDAFHAMIPHGASGGNSAIEDAVCIAECLDWAWRRHIDDREELTRSIARATQAFEDIRKPRVERMQIASHEGYDFLSGVDPDFLVIRDKGLADATKMYDGLLQLSEEERTKIPKEQAVMDARAMTEPYFQWCYGYDAVQATKSHLESLG